MAGDTGCGRRIAKWPGSVLTDAMPLRLAGGLHHLFRQGAAPELGPVYAQEVTEQSEVDAIVAAVVSRHDAELLPWFDGPPQTNEAGRSASFVAALHWLASRTTSRFELNEIGSSAGMNLLIDRYGYGLGGVRSGPADAPCVIAPDWQGEPPPATPFRIEVVRGCDLNPIDVRDNAAADRLMAYIWPEAEARFARMEAGIAMIRARDEAHAIPTTARNATAITKSWPSSTPTLKPISAGTKAPSGRPNSPRTDANPDRAANRNRTRSPAATG